MDQSVLDFWPVLELTDTYIIHYSHLPIALIGSQPLLTYYFKMKSFLSITLLLQVVGQSEAFVSPSTTTSRPAVYESTSALSMTKDFDLVRGFESICLHAGYLPDPTTTSRGVPLHRTAPYVFKDTETAANLFALAELGNIYSKSVIRRRTFGAVQKSRRDNGM